jgi:ribosomal protein S18 acetylase RimI-like enzyme
VKSLITYKSCTEVNPHEIYEAFNLGYVDYFVPLTMNEEDFFAHFFGPEGNQMEHSYIALKQNQPIGLLLGGIRYFDSLKTMRCGTLCLGPEYRGRGISQSLFELHRKGAVEAGCKQLCLEVLRENQRAIRFYEKMGYREAYLLKYYSGSLTSISANVIPPEFQLKQITYEILKTARDRLSSCHINWQSDIPYFEHSTQEVFLGLYNDCNLIAEIAMSSKGKINFLWVEPPYRNKKLGTYLVLQAATYQKVDKVTICIPSNAFLEGFFRKLNFQKDRIEQYEMYLPI